MSTSTVTEWIAIVNLRSGGRARPEAFARRLESAVSRVFVSERAGHVDSLVRACPDATGIVVAGGDGTLFEVLQACDRARQKILLIPSGRGNSLAKDLGMDADCDPVACVQHGIDRAIDLLDVELVMHDGRRWTGVSASNLAIGYPAEVARQAARWRRFGPRSYAIAALTARIESLNVRIRCDDEQDESANVTGFVISNSRYVGPFLGFPSSSLGDGICHTIEMRAGRIRQAVHNLSSFSGLGFYEPGVRRDIRAIRIVLDTPSLMKIDGELRTGVSEIHARLSPAAVTFRIPAATDA